MITTTSSGQTFYPGEASAQGNSLNTNQNYPNYTSYYFPLYDFIQSPAGTLYRVNRNSGEAWQNIGSMWEKIMEPKP